MDSPPGIHLHLLVQQRTLHSHYPTKLHAMLSRSSKIKPKGKDALVVVSCPEDLVCYYYPTHDGLRRRNVNISVLALSPGPSLAPPEKVKHVFNELKIKEFKQVNDPRLTFGQPWSSTSVAQHVGEAIESLRPDMVITCDEGGLTFKPNNKDVHAGVKAYITQRKSQLLKVANDDAKDDYELPEVWCQKTVNSFRRFSGKNDLGPWLADLIQKKPQHVVFGYSIARCGVHQLWKLSPMTWARKLGWVLGSWYFFFNELNLVA